LKATHIASAIGKGFAFLLIGWGIINFFTGALLAGIWLVVIGFFLEEAAMSGYQQLLIRKVLMGEKVSSFVSTNIQLIPADIDLELAVNQYFLPLRHFIFPVQAQGRIAGVVRLTEVKDIDRPTWPYTSISNVMIPLSEAYVVSPELDALHALNLMAQNQLGFLLVMDHDKFVGLVTHADLSRFYEIKNSLVRA
jgi:predicted transcriptional regulator